MTYAIAGMALQSSPPNTAVPNIWGYINLSDTLATIEASDYFGDETRLALYDVIRATGSDGTAWLRVSAITPAVTVVVDTNAVSSLTDGRVWVGNASNAATAVLLSGDITITNTGVATIANLAVSAAKLAADAVTTAKILDGNVTSAKMSSLLVKYAAVAISAAEFNGMYAAPKLLVAAGGANTLHILHRVDLLMTYVSANYAAGGVAAVQYDSTVNGAGVIASTTLSAATFQAAASTGFMFNTGVVPQTFSTCVNKGLYLSNVTGAFTTGDSTFVAHVYYSTIPTV